MELFSRIPETIVDVVDTTCNILISVKRKADLQHFRHNLSRFTLICTGIVSTSSQRLFTKLLPVLLSVKTRDVLPVTCTRQVSYRTERPTEA